MPAVELGLFGRGPIQLALGRWFARKNAVTASASSRPLPALITSSATLARWSKSSVSLSSALISSPTARRATWDQFDLEAAVWVKPAEATKTAKSHRVPLSRQALDLLEKRRPVMQRWADCIS